MINLGEKIELYAHTSAPSTRDLIYVEARTRLEFIVEPVLLFYALKLSRRRRPLYVRLVNANVRKYVRPLS